MSNDNSGDITQTVELTFSDNRLLPSLYGEHGRHLTRIEHALGIRVDCKGNTVSLAGNSNKVQYGRKVVEGLWKLVQANGHLTLEEVDAAIKMLGRPVRQAASPQEADQKSEASIFDGVRLRGKNLIARSQAQSHYVKLMEAHELVLSVGPAGTGKTFLAVAQAVQALQRGAVERLILSRPAVEAGEKLGFLPGDMREKVDPYLRPMYDALHDLLGAEHVNRLIATNRIEIAPLAFMRGRTLSHAFFILDEAQNTNPMQLKMALTRLGTGSRMVVTGDLTQIDLPAGTPSGLAEAVSVLRNVEGIGIMHFANQDVVRHPLVAKIVAAYSARDLV
ncbi:MAG: PhoH family protein [Alphaproteobacteria bacterium]